MNLLHPEFEWRPKFTAAPGSHPAGSPACWFHNPVPAIGYAAYADVAAAVVSELGEGRGWVDDEQEQARLLAAASPLSDCPVCAPYGENWNRGFYDHFLRYAGGLALLSSCESCGHTIRRATHTDPDTPAPAHDPVRSSR